MCIKAKLGTSKTVFMLVYALVKATTEKERIWKFSGISLNDCVGEEQDDAKVKLLGDTNAKIGGKKKKSL